MVEGPVRTPRWVWVIIVLVASTQPLAHWITTYAPPAETIPTGLHIPDSALFLHSMDMFTSGFHSDYATCKAESGDASIRYYAVPHLWLYGLLGLVVRLLPGDPFLWYGIASGAGALLYLWVCYRFLAGFFPAIAHPAFLLFTLSGGPGGLLYVLTWLAGLHGHPLFEAYFYRFGVYDLMEGPHFQPILYFPRLYYTLSLAGCLGGMAAVIRSTIGNTARRPWLWYGAIAASSFLDARFALFCLGVLFLYTLTQIEMPFAARRRVLLEYALPAGLGIALAGALMSLNPAVIGNHQSAGAMAMWFSPFVIVTWLHWSAASPTVYAEFRSASAPLRGLLGAGMGYLVLYAVGYVAYQLYYGNLLIGRDGSVAAQVSDWALIGAAVGALLAYRLPPGAQNAPDQSSSHLVWVALWLLGFTVIALSGFGQGWFLRFGPQRCQVFLWLPLCTLAAAGLVRLPARLKIAVCGVLLGCGVSSMAVALLAFQTPLGRTAAEGPYPALHPEVMHVIDRELIAVIGEGTVLTPAPASDVVVRLNDNPTVFGIGSFNLTDRPYDELLAVATAFFSPDTSDEARREIASAWCVDWVYCPHTWPVEASTRTQLSDAPWLEEIQRSGEGAVFAVRLEQRSAE